MLAEHCVDEKRCCHVYRGIDGADPHMRAVLGREYLFEIGRRDRKDARPGHRIARDAAPEALEVACDRVFDSLAQEIHIGYEEVAVRVFNQNVAHLGQQPQAPTAHLALAATLPAPVASYVL